MSRIDIAFKASETAPSEGGSGGLPIGKHPVVMIAQETKANSAGTGGYLALTFDAIDGPAKGLSQVHRLNIYNQSATAVKIALENLSAICHVVGRSDFDSSQHDIEELFDIPFIIEVSPQKNDPKYTEVTKFFDIQGNGPTESTAQKPAASAQASWGAPAATQQAPAQTAAPAWGQQAAPTEAAPAQQPAATGGWTPPGTATAGGAPAKAPWQAPK